MTRVDFYQLDSDPDRADTLICHICEKAYQNRQTTLLLTVGSEQTERLNQKLWTFDEDSFVPHDTLLNQNFETPILIQDTIEQNCQRQLLINLSNGIPEHFAQYHRIIELVTTQNKVTARKHYQFYQSRGYPLTHHRL